MKITPDLGVPMAGYYHGRQTSGVHDDLFAKAIVIDVRGERAALVGLDLISTTGEIVAEARRLIAEATDIAPERVMISATHAHTGPVLVDTSERGKALGARSQAAADYARALPERIAESVRVAADSLVPVTVKAAISSETSLAFNRRFHMKDGGFGWNPGKLNPRILRPAGPIDPSVPVVAIVPDGSTLPSAVYVNYAMHLDTVGGTEISADFPHVVSNILRDVTGNMDLVTLFTIGCAGDINHIDVNWDHPQKGHTEAARIGAVLAGAVIEAFPKFEGIDAAGGLRAASMTVELPLPEISDDDRRRAADVLTRGTDDRSVPFLELVDAYKVMDVAGRDGAPQRVEVQVITLGTDLAWVSLPGEIFVELGIALKKGSPFKHTILATLANGAIGYIPTRAAYAQGQYEVISARVAAGSGEMLVENAVRMLREQFTAAAAAERAESN